MILSKSIYANWQILFWKWKLKFNGWLIRIPRGQVKGNMISSRHWLTSRQFLTKTAFVSAHGDLINHKLHYKSKIPNAFPEMKSGFGGEAWTRYSCRRLSRRPQQKQLWPPALTLELIDRATSNDRQISSNCDSVTTIDPRKEPRTSTAVLILYVQQGLSCFHGILIHKWTGLREHSVCTLE